MTTLRELLLVSRTGDDPPCVDSKTPPCVHSKRTRVYRHQARVLELVRVVRGRFECTHGVVLESPHGFFNVFSACRNTQTPAHTHTHQTHTTTTNNTTTKVCGTTQLGIWVLKGNARTYMFPANLDHLRVKWRKQGTYETAWVTPGHDCLCSYKYGHGAAVRPQTNNAIWHPSCHLGVVRRMCQRG